jgi:hypothetical protein
MNIVANVRRVNRHGNLALKLKCFPTLTKSQHSTVGHIESQ